MSEEQMTEALLEDTAAAKEMLEDISTKKVSMGQKKVDLEKEVTKLREALNIVPRNELINMYIAVLNESVKLAVACENLGKQLTALKSAEPTKQMETEQK